MQIQEIEKENHSHRHHSHHHHGHHHGHDHGPVSYNRAFAIGIVLNFAFVVIEAGYGFFANSLALMADAGHNLSDVVGLALAWGATWLSTRKPSARFTYGFGQTSILAALINALLLLIAVSGIIWEATVRLRHPEAVSSSVVITVAAIGILINGATALLFISGRKSDLNIRGAYLHMASDAVVSLGVVMAGIAMSYTGWLWLDPIVSLLISLVIVVGTWSLLRDSFRMALAAVPAGIEVKGIREYLGSVPGVTSVHDLHIWAMSTTQNALTAHLVIPAGHPGDEFIKKISHHLECKFNVNHATLQIELGDPAHKCELEPDDVV